METWKKVAVCVGVLALAGGAGKNAEKATTDPSESYGPAEFGEDVGDGVDRFADGVGDAAGGAFGRSDVAKAGALGAGGYGAYRGWKKWGGGRNRDEPAPAPEDVEEPTLPTVAPMWGVTK